MIEGYTLEVPLGSTDGKALGLDEAIILGSALGEVLGCTLRDAVVSDLGSSDGYLRADASDRKSVVNPAS